MTPVYICYDLQSVNTLCLAYYIHRFPNPATSSPCQSPREFNVRLRSSCQGIPCQDMLVLPERSSQLATCCNEKLPILQFHPDGLPTTLTAACARVLGVIGIFQCHSQQIRRRASNAVFPPTDYVVVIEGDTIADVMSFHFPLHGAIPVEESYNARRSNVQKSRCSITICTRLYSVLTQDAA